MPDVDAIIIERIQRLDGYLNELRELQGEVDFEIYQRDKFKRKFIERTLHTALEACLDIGNRLISLEGYRQPEDNKDVFVVLTEAGILQQDKLETFKRMAGFRNILVHEYAKLDDAAVYGVFQKRLDDLATFAEAVMMHITSSKESQD
ncbi:MAG: DUF86 domain-containing protein [Anaerolineae bacterium]